MPAGGNWPAWGDLAVYPHPKTHRKPWAFDVWPGAMAQLQGLVIGVYKATKFPASQMATGDYRQWNPARQHPPPSLGTPPATLPAWCFHQAVELMSFEQHPSLSSHQLPPSRRQDKTTLGADGDPALAMGDNGGLSGSSLHSGRYYLSAS